MGGRVRVYPPGAPLRAVPPLGSWVAVPEDGSRPGPAGFLRREDAEAEALRLGHPYVARVVLGHTGWSVGDLHLVDTTGGPR